MCWFLIGHCGIPNTDFCNKFEVWDKSQILRSKFIGSGPGVKASCRSWFKSQTPHMVSRALVTPEYIVRGQSDNIASRVIALHVTTQVQSPILHMVPWTPLEVIPGHKIRSKLWVSPMWPPPNREWPEYCLYGPRLPTKCRDELMNRWNGK